MKYLLLLVGFFAVFSTVAQTYSGVLTTNSPHFDSPEPNGDAPPVAYAVGTYYYELVAFSVPVPGPYTFRGTTSFVANGTTYGSEGILYQAPGPVADADRTLGASRTNALVAVGSGRPTFTLTRYLAAGQYYLAVSTYAEGLTGPYTLEIAGPAPLPVELTRFTARGEGAGVRLAWATASEHQNAFFVVERSADAQQWQALVRVPGQQTSSRPHDYAWVDAGVPAGFWYYRLQQTDADGHVHASPVVGLRVSAPARVTFFPNPVLGHVTFTTPTATTLTMCDATGRPCRIFTLAGGDRSVVLDDLPAGVYLLTDEATQQTLRLVKGTP